MIKFESNPIGVSFQGLLNTNLDDRQGHSKSTSEFLNLFKTMIFLVSEKDQTVHIIPYAEYLVQINKYQAILKGNCINRIDIVSIVSGVWVTPIRGWDHSRSIEGRDTLDKDTSNKHLSTCNYVNSVSNWNCLGSKTFF